MDERLKIHKIPTPVDFMLHTPLYQELNIWKYFKTLRRLGQLWNHKRVRLYCSLRLNQKQGLSQRIKQPQLVPQQPNQIWSADFVSNALYTGKRFRIFNVIDDFNRECLAV